MGYEPYFDYSYDFGAMDNPSVFGVIFLVMMGIYALVFLYAIVAHVLGSLGIYTIAVRREIKHPWLAWLPCGNLWILGSIADQYQYVSLGQVKNRRKVLLGLQIANVVLVLAMLSSYVYIVVEALIRAGGDPNLFDQEAMIASSLVIMLIVLAIYVLSMITMVFRYISLYNLYASCLPSGKTVFILLSIFLSFTEPFLVFACRKKDDGMPPRKTETPREIPETAPIPEETPAEEAVPAGTEE